MDEMVNDGATETAETPVSDNSSSPEQSSSGSGAQDASSEGNTEASTPFHKHPRFQELVNQKNELSQRIGQYEERMKAQQAQFEQMQAQYKQSQQPQGPTYKALLDRLQGIDPEFAKFQEQIAQAAEYVPALQQELQTLKAERMRSEAEGKLSSLYTEYKVPENLKSFYRQSIENAAYNNPKFGVKDLDTLFKQTHESVTKFFDDYNRKQRESYVQDKKKDATPATATGGAPSAPQTGAKKPTSLTDPSIVKMVADELRRAKQKV